MVNWTGPSASDNSGVAPHVACQPSSGHTFPIGENTVSCNATDDNGNMGRCEFKVIINGMYFYNLFYVTLLSSTVVALHSIKVVWH